MQINVLEYFNTTCERLGSKTAVADATGGWDFSTLRREALRAARGILGRTSAFNSPIAIYLPKGNPAIAAILGTLYTGNCYAPLDTKAPLPRTKSIIDHLDPIVIVTSKELSKGLIEAGCDSTRLLLLEELPAAGGDAPTQWRKCIDTDPVYIIHTSGSTGRPKGVVITHRGVIDYIDWAKDCFAIDEQAIIANQAPLIFDNSTLDLYLCFSCGATLHLLPEELFLFPMRLMEYLAQHRSNFLFWVPSIMVNVANRGILDRVPDLALTKILFAGEVMPARQLNMWRARFPQALFANLYGPTEITVDCTYYVVDRELRDDEPVPIGYACRNSGVLILNDQSRQCAQGERGELCVRGSSLALGYWKDSAQTAAAFVQNPLHSRYPEVIYRTGDLVYTNERDEIIFVGRKDFQIKHMGYRIELGEIEHSVLQIPGIRNACVFYHRAKQEIAMVYEAETDLDPGFIRSELGRSLPKYMWPTMIRRRPELPCTPSGKIDRQQILKEYAE